MNRIQFQDIEEFVSSFPFSDLLAHRSVLVTGATGLVGSTLVHCIAALNEDIHITCPVRNVEKARLLFNNLTVRIKIIESDLVSWIDSLDTHFDYVIHCASPTNGAYMMQNPVETFNFIYDSTKSLLEYARRNPVCSMVFVSSVEYYGQVLDDVEIDESYQGYIDIDSPRSCYPMGKRMSEFICKAYQNEYNVPVKCARLTQTFGAGVAETDNRVYAQFARSIINSQDIILHTDGTSSKQYCYITDTISALLYILLKGVDGVSYNVANPDTYVSIKDMAFLLKSEFNPNIEVRFDIKENTGYAPATKLCLKTNLLYNLGWRPRYGLLEMYHRLINSMSDFLTDN